MITPAVEGPQNPPKPIGEIRIDEPTDGALVEARQRVSGVAEEPLHVRVVVHPVDTGAFWVQPLPTTGSDGHWSVDAYFGRLGDIDKGRVFEVMAVGYPSQGLEQGTVLDRWPEAPQRSPAIRVKRK